jgi:uncharacterized protein YcgI (DUF1989 family)
MYWNFSNTHLNVLINLQKNFRSFFKALKELWKKLNFFQNTGIGHYNQSIFLHYCYKLFVNRKALN